MADAIQIGDAQDVAAREQADAAKAAGALVPFHVRSVFKFDPDAELDKISQLITTKIVNIDAKIFEERHAGGRARYRSHDRKHLRSATEFFKSPTVRARIRESMRDAELTDIKDRLQEYVPDYPDESPTRAAQPVFELNDTILPSLYGPGNRQTVWYNVLDGYRKAQEAARRNPLGRRIIRIIPQFVISRGVKGSHPDPAYDKIWKAFHKRNQMRLRIKKFLEELVIYGDLFLRYFKTPAGLVVRSLDPGSIWEIITNPEDIEDVYYYHQQYTSVNQMVLATPPDGRTVPPATLVIRQIPGEDVRHVKINCDLHEKRGRSELFTILSWLIRFREYATDRVIMNKMRAMFGLDVSVKGTADDANRVNDQFRTPPGSGSVWVHNDNVAMDFKAAQTTASDSKTDADMFLRIIAVGSGVSEQFLGVGSEGTRTGALIQTEPDVKNFEDFREIVEDVLLDMSERAVEAAGKDAPDVDFEFTFPSIASEDRSAKLKDIVLSETNDYFSKERAATMAAREFDISNYRYDDEQRTIHEERATNPMAAIGMQQVPKITPPGALVPGGAPGAKAAGGGKPAVRYTGAQSGFAANLGGRGMQTTKPTLDRSNFSRSSEKTAITNNRTSTTPRFGEGESLGSAAVVTATRMRKRRKRDRLLTPNADPKP